MVAVEEAHSDGRQGSVGRWRSTGRSVATPVYTWFSIVALGSFRKGEFVHPPPPNLVRGWTDLVRCKPIEQLMARNLFIHHCHIQHLRWTSPLIQQEICTQWVGGGLTLWRRIQGNGGGLDNRWTYLVKKESQRGFNEGASICRRRCLPFAGSYCGGCLVCCRRNPSRVTLKRRAPESGGGGWRWLGFCFSGVVVAVVVCRRWRRWVAEVVSRGRRWVAEGWSNLTLLCF
jgi:hypothetical protein